MKKITIGLIVFILIGSFVFLLLPIGLDGDLAADENAISISNMIEIKEDISLDTYGYPADKYRIQENRIRKNQSIYVLLDNMDLTPSRIYEIQKNLDGYIDTRKIIPGQKYVTYSDANNGNPVRLIYHPNALDYVVIDWENEIEISKGKKEIDIQVKEASGMISSSLYETLTSQDLNPGLAYSLSEIFAWQIDFFRLYKGDQFKVIYEERFVDDKPYGIGKIIAAEFEHRGEKFEVFYFDNGDQIGYFDGEGNSAQKVLLKAPFKYSQRISSGFSHSRFHPVLKRRTPHYGVDYAAPLGTPVIAVGDGEVVESRYRGPNGNIVKIKHNSMYTTAYLHLNGFARGIKKGRKVKQGQVIGYVGKTGRVTGVHLDYRVYMDDKPVNPLKLKLPASKAVEAKYLSDYQKERDKLKFLLSQIEGSLAAS